MSKEATLKTALSRLSDEMLAKVLKEAYASGQAWMKQVVAAELFERSLRVAS